MKTMDEILAALEIHPMGDPIHTPKGVEMMGTDENNMLRIVGVAFKFGGEMKVAFPLWAEYTAGVKPTVDFIREEIARAIFLRLNTRTQWKEDGQNER